MVCCWSRLILREERPSGKILLTLSEYALCQEHLVGASGSGCGCARCMNTRLIKFAGLPGGLQLVSAHTHMHTHMNAYMCTCKTRSHTLQGQTEGGRACKPLIRSAQIWYHCNQISVGAEYSISGFNQSSVTFVAEKWHGAIVPNVITGLASCTLRTVENTDTAEGDGWTRLAHATPWTNTGGLEPLKSPSCCYNVPFDDSDNLSQSETLLQDKTGEDGRHKERHRFAEFDTYVYEIKLIAGAVLMWHLLIIIPHYFNS